MFFLPYSTASVPFTVMSEQLLLPPPLTQSLSQAQSLGWIQIFLNASLACIFHTRELIPWQSPCFRTRYIDQIETTSHELEPRGNLYSAFCELNVPHFSTSQELRVLVKGYHKHADQILDMLVRLHDPLRRLFPSKLTHLYVRKPVFSRLFSKAIFPLSKSLLLK